MGATNVIAAYQLYAGRVPATSMQLLAFMAVVSRDDDDKPWYGQGHEALALHALGRPAPATDTDLRAVRRGIEPLLSIGAIEADRRAAVRKDGPNTVRYRLRLVAFAPPDIDEPLVDNSLNGHPAAASRRTVSGPHVGRFVDSRRTVSDPTQDGNRPTEEPGGTTRSEEEENHLDLESDSPPSTGTAPRTEEETPIDDDHDGCCPGCGVLLDPDRVCRNRACTDGMAVVIPIRRPA